MDNTIFWRPYIRTAEVALNPLASTPGESISFEIYDIATLAIMGHLTAYADGHLTGHQTSDIRNYLSFYMYEVLHLGPYAGSTLNLKLGIPAAAGTLLRKGSVLISKRRPEQTFSGQFEFPGGKVEPGETIRNCLCREMAEEIGVQVREQDLIADCTMVHADQNKCYILPIFTTAIFEGEPVAKENQDIQWVKFDELQNYPLIPGDNFFLPRMLQWKSLSQAL